MVLNESQYKTLSQCLDKLIPSSISQGMPSASQVVNIEALLSSSFSNNNETQILRDRLDSIGASDNLDVENDDVRQIANLIGEALVIAYYSSSLVKTRLGQDIGGNELEGVKMPDIDLSLLSNVRKMGQIYKLPT